ncbi:MAG: ATP-binding cassette domain-containing protein [Methylobacteriaceae bacterium]|nr:ATP-binding cassette domain-containing protein [Methylobacteriaceae bacterium]
MSHVSTDRSPTSPPARTSLRALAPLLPYAARYRGRILAALAALTLASLATLTVPLAVRRMIDYGFGAEGAGLIDSYFLAMIAVVAVLALASAARYYLVITLGERVVADLRADLFRHLAHLDAAFYDTARTGELVSRLTADATQLKSTFGASASIALRNLFMFLGAIVMMVATSPKLSGLVLIAIPLIVLPLVASGRTVRARSRRAQDKLAEATAYAAENLGAVRTMQSFAAEATTSARFARAAEEAYDAARSATAARSWLTGVAIFLAFASVVGVLWLGAQDVLARRMSGGELSQFVLYAVFGAGALGALSEVWSEVSAAAGAAGRIADLLAAAPRVAAPAAPATLPVPPRGEVAFEHVAFAYPTRPGQSALRDLSLVVAAGESVAIVGPSGAGKTTIIQLLMRFYDPDRGLVRVDGVDVRTLDPAALRARIALVPQDPVIFAASVLDNIRYGRPGASEAEAIEAARRAAADDFVRAMPEGYATRIGERGVTLSGGQRQRIAIARAILKDAPILLLDEATSALDAENEAQVQEALEALMKGRTTLVIAHRLATVLSCDRILVMDEGRIVEEGRHADLAARDGLYARLARLQFESGAAGLVDAAG